MYLGHDVLIIVIPQGSTQLIVIHVGLILPFSPAFGHLERERERGRERVREVLL